MRSLKILSALLVSLCCVLTGCYQTYVDNLDKMPADTEASSDDSSIEEKLTATLPKLPSAGFEFDAPVRIKAGGEFVSVEEPGYASPTMADVDGDGRADLVVGQQTEGHMLFFKNVSSVTDSLKFAACDWIKTGDQRAVVPGVS